MKHFIFAGLLLTSLCLFAQNSVIYTINDVSTYPVFPDNECIVPGTEDCFTEQLQNHIRWNFMYPNTNQTGNVYVQFVIDSTGNVTDIRARSKVKAFENEGIRIIQQIPKLEPAKLDGRPVSIRYSTPIAFNKVVVSGQNQPSSRIGTVEVNLTPTTNNAILSHKETSRPPVYRGCKKKENKIACFDRQISIELSQFITQSRSVKNIKQISARIYFEIGADTSIENLVIITPEKAVKERIEKFFQTSNKIVEAARDKDGNAISCYYNLDLNLMGVTRTKTIR